MWKGRGGGMDVCPRVSGWEEHASCAAHMQVNCAGHSADHVRKLCRQPRDAREVWGAEAGYPSVWGVSCPSSDG
jgi:hypothetical protein